MLLLPLFYSSVRVLMGSPLLPSSPLKYKRAFIGGGRQEKVKHGMTARSYLKIACALRWQGRHKQEWEQKKPWFDYNQRVIRTPEKHIVHLQQAICGLLKTTKRYFIHVWTTDLQLGSENQSCLAGWAEQVKNAVKDTN